VYHDPKEDPLELQQMFKNLGELKQTINEMDELSKINKKVLL
jgi:hypothetical protein